MDITSADRLDLIEGIEEILENFDEYELAEDHYTGDKGEVFTSPKLARFLGRTGDHFRINLAKTPVDVVAERLSIAAVTVPEDEEKTRILQEEVWDRNHLLMKSKDWNLRACEYGDAYIFVWPGPDDGEDDRKVILTFNNPKTTRVIYDEETNSIPLYAVKLWKEGKRYRANVYYPDVIERWATLPDAAAKDAQSWKPYSEDADGIDPDTNLPNWPLENPFGRIPIFHLRNGEPYGTPEHRAGYGAQNAINKLIVTQMATTDYHGFPQRYALKVDPDVEGGGDDDDIDWNDDPSLVGSTRTEADISKLQSGPGELWYLSGVRSAGQFEAADPSKFLDPAEFYIRLMAQVTTTPLHYFDPSGDVPSGESLRAANAPLDKKVTDRQQRFASTWAAILSFALEILGYPDVKVDVRWSPSGTIDDKEGWDTSAGKISNGVPLRQVLLEAGYTAEQCDEWGIPDAVSDAPLKRKIDLLVTFAAAVQGLGAAETLGVISSADIRGLIDQVIAGTTSVDNGP